MDEPSSYRIERPSYESAVSIVIPLNNEAEHLTCLLRDIRAVMSSQPLPWEMILVDDGSTDDTLNRLLSAREEFSNLTVLALERCCGQSAATWLGLLQAKGSIVVTLDGDGQFEPGDILTLISEVTAGMDFAIGHRQSRADRWHKRLFSRVSNGLRRVLTNSSLPETGCSLRAFRRHVLEDVIPFQAIHRFLPTMVEMSGYRCSVVPVRHRRRQSGTSHYGILDRLPRSILDGLAVWWLKKRAIPKTKTSVYIARQCLDSSQPRHDTSMSKT